MANADKTARNAGRFRSNYRWCKRILNDEPEDRRSTRRRGRNTGTVRTRWRKWTFPVSTVSAVHFNKHFTPVKANFREALLKGKAQYVRLASLDRLLFALEILFAYVAKQAALMRRSSVLSFSLQLVFPAYLEVRFSRRSPTQNKSLFVSISKKLFYFKTIKTNTFW
jgi:hypothetical protein